MESGTRYLRVTKVRRWFGADYAGIPRPVISCTGLAQGVISLLLAPSAGGVLVALFDAIPGACSHDFGFSWASRPTFALCAGVRPAALRRSSP